MFFSLPALGAFRRVELDSLARLQRTETLRLDDDVMDKSVLAAFTAMPAQTV